MRQPSRRSAVATWNEAAEYGEALEPAKGASNARRIPPKSLRSGASKFGASALLKLLEAETAKGWRPRDLLKQEIESKTSEPPEASSKPLRAGQART